MSRQEFKSASVAKVEVTMARYNAMPGRGYFDNARRPSEHYRAGSFREIRPQLSSAGVDMPKRAFKVLPRQAWPMSEMRYVVCMRAENRAENSKMGQ